MVTRELVCKTNDPVRMNSMKFNNKPITFRKPYNTENVYSGYVITIFLSERLFDVYLIIID